MGWARPSSIFGLTRIRGRDLLSNILSGITIHREGLTLERTLSHPRFAFFMPVGPGDGPMAIDTLESLFHFYPQADVWLVDDCTEDGTYPLLAQWCAGKPAVNLLRNPSFRTSYHLICGFAMAMQAILASHKPYAFVCRIDSDVFFTGPDLDALIARRLREEGPGAVGNYRLDVDGSRRDWSLFRKKIFLDLLPVGLAKESSMRLRIGWPRYLSYLVPALSKGYQPGENLYGPCYALDMQVIQALSSNGFWQRLSEPSPALLVEDDALVCLGVRAAGFPLIELEPDVTEPAGRHPVSQKARIARLHYRELPTWSPEQTVMAGVAIIHPLEWQDPRARAYRDALRALRKV